MCSCHCNGLLPTPKRSSNNDVNDRQVMCRFLYSPVSRRVTWSAMLEGKRGEKMGAEGGGGAFLQLSFFASIESKVHKSTRGIKCAVHVLFWAHLLPTPSPSPSGVLITDTSSWLGKTKPRTRGGA